MHRRVHLAGVVANKKLQLFVDGKLMNSTPLRAEQLREELNVPLLVGSAGLVGTIDQARVSQSARYTKDFTPQKRFALDADTLALYHFDEGSGDVLKDSSGNGHHGKIVGARWVKADGMVIAPLDPTWLKAVAAMKPAEQLEAVKAELIKRNRGFDGTLTRQLDRDGMVTRLDFAGDKIDDLAPVRALPHLKNLHVSIHAGSREGPLALTPLKGMMLDALVLNRMNVVDLTPLKGMKLNAFQAGGSDLADLTPLQGMPMTYLCCDGTRVANLAPLEGMPLTVLICYDTPITDLKPLREMKLTNLQIADTKVTDLAPLKGMPLKTLYCQNTKVTDLSLLKEMPLEELMCNDELARKHAEVLRSIKTLKTINGIDAKRFWDELDSGGRTFKNAIGMKFALVPMGKAWLGGGAGKPGTKEVVIKDDFCLGVYEVTQEEWLKLMEVNPSYASRTGPRKELVKNVSDEDLKRFPVENVSWQMVEEFIRRVNERTKEAGWVYRLPTETEWEYACRGGPMADQAESAFDFYLEKPTNTLLPKQARFSADEILAVPCKVGSYPPNRLGLYDMHGNVWEWCDGEARFDPKDPKGNWQRVDRGGSYPSNAWWCRASARHVSPTTNRSNALGLRLARVPVSKESK